MKKALLILGVIVLVALVAAGSFWGGMQFQSRQAEKIQANFFAARGGANPGQMQGNGQFSGNGQIPGGGQGFPGGRGTVGQIKTVEGNTVTLSTAENVTTVKLSGSTVIRKTTTVEAGELQPGVRVMVTGKTGEDGKVDAQQITILDENAARGPGQPPAGMEP